MQLLIRLFTTALLVLLIAEFLPGVAVASFTTSLLVALVLSLLNVFIKPILILFTLPVTILSLGLFLLVINALLIILCAKIVGGFVVDGFWTAVFFSIILSVLQSLTYSLTQNNKD
ncbi:MAG: phage holin family protein [Flavobacterium sp.]|jgi:putative membrane protein|nr:phage holin family protein [Flavobacterium sp.]